MLRHAVALLLAGLIISGGANRLTGAPPDDRTGKWRILVDKVVSHETRPNVTNDQVREIADAGFNVIVPRWGGDNLVIVRHGATLAQRNGIRYMPWIRASAYTQDPARMMVWRDGVVGTKALYSPNCEELWKKITELLEAHARLSRSIPSLVGTFLDFENYDTHGGYGHCYDLSYDELILDRFSKFANIEIPRLQPRDRYPWLVEHNHHDEFEKFQIGEWKRRCRALRDRIDAINPSFQLAVYPVPGPRFLEEAAYRNWSTRAAPLILADAATYGPPMRFVKHKAALRENRRKLLDHISYVRKLGIPFQYVGGVDPIVDPGNPEFHGKNADMIASVGDGYWVFYEGPTRGQDDHRKAFDWFARANRSIKRQTFHLQYQPRQTPERELPATIQRVPGKLTIAHDGVTIGLHKALNRTGRFHARSLESLDLKYLQSADIVWIQAGMRWMDGSPELVANLRSYVERGGRLLVTHLGWSKTACAHQHADKFATTLLDIHPVPAMDMFREVASWSAPRHDRCRGPYVLDDRIVVTDPDFVPGLNTRTKLITNSPNHMVLLAGQHGRVIAEDGFGDPVCVSGQLGKGRVVLSGCYYGYWAPARTFPFGCAEERQLFYAMLDWLVEGKDGQ